MVQLLGSLLVIAAVVAYNVWKSKRRGAQSDALREMAGRLGMAFHRDGSPFRSESFHFLPLFSRGEEQRLSNVLQGDDELILELSYLVRGHRQSVRVYVSLYVRIDRGSPLPYVTLQPAGLAERIGLVGDDVEIPEDPGFSRAYRVQGAESDVRQVCGHALRSFLVREPCWGIQSSGENLLIFRHEPVTPEALPGFLEKGREIAGYVRASAG